MIDLHNHSTVSDGEYSPEELVDMAKWAGFSAFAVSDHDTLEGSLRAVQRGSEVGLNIVPAVEVSASFKGKVLHLLGYYVDLADEALVDKLATIREYRVARAKMMVGKINEELAGEGKRPMDLGVVLARGRERPITRPDLARYLMELGHAANMKEAFERWLVKYNVPNEDLSAAAAIALIHAAGGVAVLAHPLSRTMSLREISPDLDEQIRLLKELKDEGLDGVEVYRFEHSPEDEQRYIEMARNLGLILSGGSDYHGPATSGGAPTFGAVAVPDEVAEEMARRAAEIKSYCRKG